MPPVKSMPRFRPLPPIASAPISKIVPESEKNHLEAPMKSKLQPRPRRRAPSIAGWLTKRERPITPSAAWVASTAVNSVSKVPMPSVKAKPCTWAVASANRMKAVMNVTTLASTIAAKPRLYPAAMPAVTERPPGSPP